MPQRALLTIVLHAAVVAGVFSRQLGAQELLVPWAMAIGFYFPKISRRLEDGQLRLMTRPGPL